MKKFLLWCLGTFVAAVIAIAGSITVISCDQAGSKVLYPAVGVSVEEVAEALDSIVNPRLSTCRDVFELQRKLVVNAYMDSVFTSIDQQTLENVASVCFGRLHVVTKDDIVSEFIKNRSIYENLPSKNDPPNATTDTLASVNLPPAAVQIIKESTTTASEEPPTRVEDKPGNYKDTVIDGKHAIIKQ